ncbi:MAG: AmmeMemoRadiSam system protein B [Planctomycetota bacterium]
MNVRESVLAGSWYQANPDTLRKEINKYLSNVKLPADAPNEVSALVSPHAGHQYSGQAAAYGYSLLKGKSFKRVIIMGPSHRVGFEGVSVSKATHYETPLGKVPLDRTACDKLIQSKLFSYQATADKMEHSLEIQLPFLQVVLEDGYKIVPLVVGEVDNYQETAKAIKGIIDDQTLVIASSDFTHYGDDFGYVPFTDNIKENLKKLDGEAIEQIISRSPDGFQRYIKSTGATVCGYKPIILLLYILGGENKATLLNYYTSGDLTGDYLHCVSYASIAFSRGVLQYAPTKKMDEEGTDDLNKSEQETLLKLARQTLKEYLKNGKTPKVDEKELTARLKEKRGVFVTLKKHGDLRGCIGSIFEPKPLYLGVIEQAVNSAVNDWRFSPVTAAEEKEIDIEISVLSPMKKVASYNDIVVGKHGVYLIKGGCTAVFLPQVAPEQGWTRDQMLEHLSMKAGLSKDAWRQGAEFMVFTAQVFFEKE